MDYLSWPRRDMSVETLQLDSSNPRLVSKSGGNSQADVIKGLIDGFDIKELAKSIAEVGYFADKALIVVEEEGRYVVVEGNRRLAALKLLRNPDLAPEEVRAVFARMAKKIDRDRYRKIPVQIAPDRDSAAVLIFSMHSGSSILQWTPLAQARFIASKAKGRSDVDTSEAIGLSTSRIRAAREYVALYDLACAVELPEDLREYVQDEQAFPLTSLARVFESKPGRDYFRATRDSKEGFIFGLSYVEFAKPFARLIADLKSGHASSRKLNQDDDIGKYLENLPKSAQPDYNKVGSFAPSEIVAPPEVAQEPRAVPQSPKSRATPPVGVFRGVSCDARAKRIQELFIEVKGLKLATHPNLIAIGLRVLVDLSVQHFARAINEYDRIQKAAANGRRNYSPSLSDLLDDKALRKILLDGFNHQQGEAITQLLNSDKHPVTLRQLNGFVHSDYHHPTERDLRAFAETFTPVFVRMWDSSFAKSKKP